MSTNSSAELPSANRRDDRSRCATWCVAEHDADPACWATDDHAVPLSMEEGYQNAVRPDQILLSDPPCVNVYAYRQEPHYREVVYLHVYRVSDNEFRCLDASVHLTAGEATALADHLLAVAEQIGGA